MPDNADFRRAVAAEFVDKITKGILSDALDGGPSWQDTTPEEVERRLIQCNEENRRECPWLEPITLNELYVASDAKLSDIRPQNSTASESYRIGAHVQNLIEQAIAKSDEIAIFAKVEQDEYEALLSQYPPEDIVDFSGDIAEGEEYKEEDEALEANGGCWQCAKGCPCRERIENDISDILTEAGLEEADRLPVLKWMMENGYSSLNQSIAGMAEEFVEGRGKPAETTISAILAAQNDAFRQCLGLNKPVVFRDAEIAGVVTFTPGIQALPPERQQEVLRMIREFNSFTEENDPWGEHDFGSFDLDGETIMFKVDYYDKALEFGSPQPSNLKQTARVLTVMTGPEY